MAKTWKKTTDFDASAELLLKVMTDPGFQEASTLKDPACVKAAFKERSHTEDRIVFDVEGEEYARSLTGIDKKKTERSKTHYEFDLKARRGTWQYTSDNKMMDRIKVTGTETIAAKGDKATLTSECTLEVKIPLIGGKVEGFILKEIEQGRAPFEATVREYLKKLG